MRKLFVFGALLALIASSCVKSNDNNGSCTPQPVSKELPSMQKFAADSSIDAVQDPTGILYQVLDPGTGAAPAATDSITINYVGRFLNGRQFDAGTNVTFKLSKLIEGWRIGIPKIKTGGKIKLIVQSSLAYGCTGVSDPYTGQVYIPANQPLYFYVELLGIKPN